MFLLFKHVFRFKFVSPITQQFVIEVDDNPGRYHWSIQIRVHDCYIGKQLLSILNYLSIQNGSV